jgi:hypothetical protein
MGIVYWLIEILRFQSIIYHVVTLFLSLWISVKKLLILAEVAIRVRIELHVLCIVLFV